MARLFGRDDVRGAARTALAEPDVHGVLLTGDAGIGKTRLATSLLAEAADTGRPTRVVRGSPQARQVPAAPLLTWLADAGDAAPDALGPAVALRRHLAEADDVPLVLADDADQVDDTTLDALLDLAEAGLLTLVVTQRSGTRRLPRVQAAAQRGSLHRLDLGPLDRASTVGLAEDLLGHALAPDARRRLHSLSSGNALYAREVATAWAEGDLLRPGPAGHHLGGPHGDRLRQPRLVDLLADRLDGCSEAERRTLVAVAACEPVITTDLGDVADTASVESLHRRDLLSVEPGPRGLVLSSGHPLLGELIRQQSSPFEVAGARRAVAAAWRAAGTDLTEHRLQVATWALEGGLPVERAEMRAAAVVALERHEVDLAERLAFAAQDGSFSCGRTNAAVLYRRGDLATLRTMAEPWTSAAETPDQAWEARRTLASAEYWLGGDPTRLASLVTDPATPGVLREAVRAALLVTQGSIGAAADAARSTLTEAGTADGRVDPRARFAATLALAIAHNYEGHPASGLAHVTDVLERGAGVEHDVLAHSDLVYAGPHMVSLTLLGRWGEAVAFASDTLALARDVGDPEHTGLLLYSVGCLHLDFGLVDDALPALAEARRWLASVGQVVKEGWVVAAEAYAHAALGEPDRAEVLLADLDARPEHPARIDHSYVARARAALAHRAGASTTARSLLLDELARVEAERNVLEQLLCLLDLVRVGGADDALPHARRLTGAGLEGPVLPAYLRLVEAAADPDPAVLDELCTALEAAGAANLALDAARIGADRARDAGDTDTMTSWLTRAAALRDRAGVPWPFGLDPSRTLLLSPREQEIALRAARGRSSRDIADELVLSVRTVETHLGRIYRKLGVHGRSGMARALAVPDPDGGVITPSADGAPTVGADGPVGTVLPLRRRA
ncbi:MAG: hypothetical protein CMH83_13380 [Nocardioides sp.]|nr:hypothetical protein [Nocardioides sp.]